MKYNLLNNLYKILLLSLISVSFLFSQDNEPKLINVGFSKSLFDNVDTRDAVVAIKIWADELLKNIDANITIDTKLFETDQELITAINKNEIEVVSIPFIDYVFIKDKVNIKPELITSINQKPGFDFILMVRNDSGFKTLDDLVNSRINIPNNTYGKLTKLWLYSSLKKKGKNLNNFFSEINEAKNPSQGMLPVFFKQVEACIIPSISYSTLVELNPQLKKDLITIETSPVFLNEVMCVTKTFDPKLLESIRKAAKSIGSSNKGKQILKLFKSDGIMDFNKKYLDETLTIFEQFDQIKN